MKTISYDDTAKILEFEFPNLDELDLITQDLLSQVNYWTVARPQDEHSFFEYGVIDDGLNIPSFNEKLYHWILECLKESSKFYFPNKNLDLAICDAWITKGSSGTTASSHFHEHSHLTGVLYLTDSNSQTVFDIIPRELDFFSHTLGIHEYQSVKIPSVKGKLIISPSRLNHRVRIFPGQKNNRHTYIFNTFANGLICRNPSSYLEYYVKDIKQRYKEGMAKLNSANRTNS